MEYSLISSGLAASLCEDCSEHVQLCLNIVSMEEALELSLTSVEEKTRIIEWDEEALRKHPEAETWFEAGISHEPCYLGCEGDGELPGDRYIAHGWTKQNGKDELIHLLLCVDCLIKWCA